ncbi:hypothetical protein DOT_4728 [Desulfosporosinus sp. OT]|nr:hypothetical protein DOT_4728 [Desulfosporosinus sp. OT]
MIDPMSKETEVTRSLKGIGIHIMNPIPFSCFFKVIENSVISTT